MVVYVALCSLAILAMLVHILARGAEAQFEVGSDSKGFHGLQYRYFVVYFLATFADWLQGPYVYKLYSHYGYSEGDIAVLYVIGFVSSVVCGTYVGSLADRLGRKRLCGVYCILYSFCCLTKITPDYKILLIGRIFGGISTSILFSTFEAWYIHEHLRHNYPQQWINMTMSKSTFYNAILAILAGIVANIVAESLEFGPVSPFLIAIPFLLIAGLFVHFSWDENLLHFNKANSSYFKALSLIFNPTNFNMLQLGTIQSIYESVMYTFVFLWTPVLLPMSPPLGLVFSCFMICIMIGSSLYAFLMSKNYSAENMLTCATVLAFLSLLVCTVATAQSAETFAPVCFFAFLVYEISVGIYFPAIGYLRSRVLPEEYRASITNWFRVPMNFLVCCSLLMLRSNKSESDEKSSVDTDATHSSHMAFMICTCFLVLAFLVSTSFSSTLAESERKSSDEFLIVT